MPSLAPANVKCLITIPMIQMNNNGINIFAVFSMPSDMPLINTIKFNNTNTMVYRVIINGLFSIFVS